MAPAVALTQGVQTPHFVNDLAQNTSLAFRTQEEIYRKIETKLNALETVVTLLGGEIHSIKAQLPLCCHAAFKWICVTPQWYWNKVKNHLEGIWSPNNSSLDIAKLHQEIQDIHDSHLETVCFPSTAP